MPDDVDGHFARGSALDKLDKLDDAIADYSQVLTLEPDHVQAAYARGACQNRKVHINLWSSIFSRCESDAPI